MGLEDKEFERWKEWASNEVEVLEQRLAALYTGPVVEDTGDAAVDADPALEEAASEEVSDPTPAQRQSVPGGARFTR